MALYDVLVFSSLIGGATAAYASATHAGDGPIVIAVALLLGLLVGIGTVAGFSRAGNYLHARAGYGPGYVPTLRKEFPFILFYLAAFIGIFTAVIVASSLVRLAIHHVA